MTEVSATYNHHVRAGIVRRLYQWCIDAADKPHAMWLLGIVSFVESSFFPVPPDAMLIPMSLARSQRAWFYATVCTLTSVAGGLLGYFIGAVLYDSVGHLVISVYGLSHKAEAFREAYAYWGTWIILIKGMTPIPYKLVTIVSGFAGYNILLFVLLSLIARGMRFYLVAFLISRWGKQAREILEKRLEVMGDCRRNRACCRHRDCDLCTLIILPCGRIRRVASGHAAAPPRSVMSSRRLTRSPRRRALAACPAR